MSISFGQRKKSLNIDAQKLQIARVELGVFSDFIALDGTVQPLKLVIINAVEAGYVEEILLEEGSFVSKGEPLLRLSNSDLQLDFMNKEALLLDQMNNIRNTRISLDLNHRMLKQQLLDIEYAYLEKKRLYDRNKVLFAQEVISLAEFEKSEDEYIYLARKRQLLVETINEDSVFLTHQIHQLESNSKLINLNLHMVKQSLDNLLIRAPVSGQLTSLIGEIGEHKGKGQSVGQIDVLAGYKLRTLADEHYISRITPGLKGEIKISGKLYPVQVDKVFPQVINGQFTLELSFDKRAPSDIKPGQSVPIKLQTGGKNQCLLIPKGSFYQKTSGAWIFVVKNGKASRRSIQLGRQNPTHYEIIKGLDAGEQVIISSYATYDEFETLILKNSPNKHQS
ncbi:MAG: efflux RND transporter periplasmic adaptor subunit [Bacteroidia bacterium]